MDFESPFSDKIIDLPALGAERSVRGPLFYYGHPGHPMLQLEFNNVTEDVHLNTAHLVLGDVLRHPNGSDIQFAIRWESEIRDMKLGALTGNKWSIERAEHAAQNQDLAEMGKLLRHLLQKLRNGAPMTQRGTFQEFMSFLHAIADLSGQYIRLTIPAFPRQDGHPSKAPEHAARADPHTLRMVIRHALLWFEPSRKTLYLGNRRIEWNPAHIGISADKDPSGHRRIEAGQIVSGFYERAKPDLKLTPGDIRKALGKFGLSE